MSLTLYIPDRLFAVLELRPSKHISANQIDALHAQLILEHKDAAVNVESLLRQLAHEEPNQDVARSSNGEPK